MKIILKFETCREIVEKCSEIKKTATNSSFKTTSKSFKTLAKPIKRQQIPKSMSNGKLMLPVFLHFCGLKPQKFKVGLPSH